MKIFIYKTLFVFVCVFLLFQLTFGIKINQLNTELEKIKSQENIENMKNSKLVPLTTSKLYET